MLRCRIFSFILVLSLGWGGARDGRAAIAPPPPSAGELVLFEQAYPGGEGMLIDVSGYSRPQSVLLSKEGADDFAIYDADGVTISAVDLLAGWDCNSQWNPECRARQRPAEYVNLKIVPDDRGRPGVAPICTAANATVTYPGPGFGVLPGPAARVSLPSPCSLDPGRYWLIVQFVEQEPWLGAVVGHTSSWYAFDQGRAANGSPGLFRYSAGYAAGPTCPDWEWVGRCVESWFWSDARNVEYAFRLVGQRGRAPGQIDLGVTAMPYDAATPEACDGADHLAVTPGDRINVCYRLTNRSGSDLRVHALTSTPLGGAAETSSDHRLGIGETWQFNRVVTVENQTQIVATWTARDERPGYTHDDRVHASYIDLANSATAQPVDAIVDLPFAIDFFGVPSQLVCFSENGYLVVAPPGASVPCRANQDSSLPSAPLPAVLPEGMPAILPSWLDLTPGPSAAGGKYFDVLGTQPGQRRLVFEWRDFSRYQVGGPEAGSISFEVVIDEGTNAITFLYRDMVFGDSLSPAGDHGQWATSGLQLDSSYALQYSYHEPSLTDGKAIRWQPSRPRTWTTSATLRLDPGAPQLALQTASIDASVLAGKHGHATLRFGNDGDRPLRWELQEKPVAAGASPRRPDGTGGVLPLPAQALVLNFPRLEPEWVRTDLALQRDAPEVLLNPAPFSYPTGNALWPYLSGSFLGNDFSRFYLLDTAGRFGVFDQVDQSYSLLSQRVLPRIGQPLFPSFASMSWDDRTQTLFASGWMLDPDDEDGLRSRLYRIDTQTLVAEPVGPPQNDVEFAFIAVDPAGQMYAVDLDTDSLLRIDKASGQYERVGALGRDFPWYDDASYPQDRYPGEGAGLAFDPSTGVLWFWSTIGIYTIDTHTGAAVRVSDVNAAIRTMYAFGITVPYGDCARPGDVPWLSYASANGLLQAGAQAETGIELDATALAPGRYEAKVCLHNNDPQHRYRPVAVPVVLNVTDADAILSDGFDPAG